MTSKPIPKKKPELIWRSLDDGTVIIDPDEGDVKVLNQVGAKAWELVDGVSSVDQIALEITREFDVSFIDAQQDLQEYLSEMTDQGLIVWIKDIQ